MPATDVRTASGRYALFKGGLECGCERWRIDSAPDSYVITGDQELIAPHPIPSRQQYRATLTPDWRLTGLEIRWEVGPRLLVATHHAADQMWRVRIEYGGEVK